MESKQMAELTPAQQEALKKAYYYFERDKQEADRAYAEALQRAHHDFAYCLVEAGIDPAGYSPD